MEPKKKIRSEMNAIQKKNVSFESMFSIELLLFVYGYFFDRFLHTFDNKSNWGFSIWKESGQFFSLSRIFQF